MSQQITEIEALNRIIVHQAAQLLQKDQRLTEFGEAIQRMAAQCEQHKAAAAQVQAQLDALNARLPEAIEG